MVSTMKKIPRWVHVPWFAIALAGAVVTSWGRSPIERSPWPGPVFFLALMAWGFCARWMR